MLHRCIASCVDFHFSWHLPFLSILFYQEARWRKRAVRATRAICRHAATCLPYIRGARHAATLCARKALCQRHKYYITYRARARRAATCGVAARARRKGVVTIYITLCAQRRVRCCALYAQRKAARCCAAP